MNVTGETNLAEGEHKKSRTLLVTNACLCCCKSSRKKKNSSNSVCSSCCLPYQQNQFENFKFKTKCTDYAPLAAPEKDDSDEMAEYAQIKDIYPHHQGPPQPPLPPSIPPPLATAGKKSNPLYKMPSHELISSPLTPSKSRAPPQSQLPPQHQTFHHRHRGDFKEQSKFLLFYLFFIILFILFLHYLHIYKIYFFSLEVIFFLNSGFVQIFIFFNFF